MKGFSGNMVYCFVCIFLNGLTSLIENIGQQSYMYCSLLSAMSQDDVFLYLNLFLLHVLKILMGANEYTVKYGTIAKCQG